MFLLQFQVSTFQMNEVFLYLCFVPLISTFLDGITFSFTSHLRNEHTSKYTSTEDEIGTSQQPCLGTTITEDSQVLLRTCTQHFAKAVKDNLVT